MYRIISSLSLFTHVHTRQMLIYELSLFGIDIRISILRASSSTFAHDIRSHLVRHRTLARFHAAVTEPGLRESCSPCFTRWVLHILPGISSTWASPEEEAVGSFQLLQLPKCWSCHSVPAPVRSDPHSASGGSDRRRRFLVSRSWRDRKKSGEIQNKSADYSNVSAASCSCGSSVAGIYCSGFTFFLSFCCSTGREVWYSVDWFIHGTRSAHLQWCEMFEESELSAKHLWKWRRDTCQTFESVITSL